MAFKLTKTQNKTLILTNRAQRSNVDLSAFDPHFLLANKLVTKQTSGRGIVYFFNWPQQNNAEMYALRHYRRGGLVAKIIDDSFLFTSVEQTRAYKELELLDFLQNNHVNVPSPIAGLVSTQGISYKADLITQVIPNSQELHELLQVTKVSPTTWQAIGEQIRLMHNTNVCHDDINVKNILLQQQDSSFKIYIIDFDKCGIQSDGSWKQDNLARFKRSLNKQSIKYVPDAFEESDWQALLDGYYQFNG